METRLGEMDGKKDLPLLKRIAPVGHSIKAIVSDRHAHRTEAFWITIFCGCTNKHCSTGPNRCNRHGFVSAQ